MKMLLRRSRLDLSGMEHVVATVRSMAEPERSWTGRFRVDGGVVDCVVPRKHLEGIGLKAVGKRDYGTGMRVDATTARLEVIGEVVGATVVMGEGEAIFGMTALESLGTGVDRSNLTSDSHV